MSRGSSPPPPGEFSPDDPDALFLERIIARLLEERRKRKLSLRRLADGMGYHFGHISRAERGLVQPGVILLCRWCRALDLDFVEVCRAASKQP